jgi:hypothetical protein
MSKSTRAAPRAASRAASWAAFWAALCIAAAPLRMTQPAALADSGSGAAEAQHLTIEEAADFSKQIERELAAEGVRVAILFRTGRPRENMPEGLEYTHGAFWAYRDILTDDGESRRGYAVYNLYHGDGETLPTTESYLKQDWPIDFVRGSVVDDVGVIIPSPEMQRRILAVIDSPLYAALHNPSYSLIANPHESTYQNCNTFMLGVIAAAAWETDDLEQIAANLRAHFDPQELDVGLLARIFGPMADERLRTDDQDGAIQTATYGSMAGFMEEYGLSKASYVILRDLEG